MACVAPYSPEHFTALLEFENVIDKIPIVEASASIAGELFSKHGMVATAGLSMLHKHFELSDDELLVEEVVGDQSFIRPVVTEDKSSLLPYMFKLIESGEDGAFKLIPLEYAPAAIVSNEKLQHLVSNEAFIAEFGTLLKQHQVK